MFKIINDVRQVIKPGQLPGGPWIHLATLLRSVPYKVNKEYIVFRHQPTGKVYMEEVEQQRAQLILKKIEDDKEWEDLYKYCEAAHLFEVAPKEFKIGK